VLSPISRVVLLPWIVATLSTWNTPLTTEAVSLPSVSMFM
jgi:hypothetical protein